MLATLFGKKRLTDKQVADMIVGSIVNSVDTSFCDVADFINEAPEFVSSPNVPHNHSDKFLLIVLAANVTRITKHFSTEEEHVLRRNITNSFAEMYGITPAELSKHLDDNIHLLYRVKERSSNIVYAMSKSVFHKYKLGSYQEKYFKEMNTPNPVFLRRMDQVMKNYLFNWEAFLDKYKMG